MEMVRNGLVKRSIITNKRLSKKFLEINKNNCIFF